ncbi:membrane-bound O-acyltransferase family protein [Paenibacillus sp. CAA11]|uniref:MBOAT family O-acyltransferase n=1 Tax=Paenibacillus sp. CAA11 TaxID=1532905 RepID=UPI000D3D760F|nr:MBOAT family O-acyltransferase [Paenibacillus sp. CAA11]AWB45607.1 membrane-bound O-acyltransferase family protein [Paenibacillus sp. CAA11]
MLFSSVVFLFYFLPVVLVLYYALRFSLILKNIILLIFSLFFYAWGEPWFVLIMLASIVFNYFFALWVDKYRQRKAAAKWILTLMLIFNLGLLFVFKYLAFALSIVNENTLFHINVPNIALPLGISFFTFHAISYVIDVYRQQGKVQKNLFYVALYISFFPQLVAGPILRYKTIAEQMVQRKETWQKFSVGCCRFITGLSKKVLLSNSMAIVADHIFSMSSDSGLPVSLAWLGAIAYTLQIYFDFSGYSDMAIGLGLMFGFKFEENFNYPYISKSISEFWRRWHISLGTWFKEYVYFPLGGSRVANKDKMIRNLLVVWGLTGVWHGAEWTFVIWGLINFAFIALEKVFNVDKTSRFRLLRHVYAMFVVVIGWVIFRSPSLVDAGNYLSSMFGLHGTGFWSDTTYMFMKEYAVFFILGLLFSTPIAKKINKFTVEGARFSRVFELVYPLGMIMIFLVCVAYLVKGTYNPFIYFNF